MNPMQYDMDRIMVDFKYLISKQYDKLEEYLDNGVDCPEDLLLPIKIDVIDKLHTYLEEIKEFMCWKHGFDYDEMSSSHLDENGNSIN